MSSMGVRGSHIPSAVGSVDPAKRPTAKKPAGQKAPAKTAKKPKGTKGKR